MGKSFEDVIQSLTESQNKSDDLMTKLAAGEDVDIHDVMLAWEENDINFRVAMGIRGKLIDAYREIIRMPV
jgi:flagellar hook-basal body complex protein FliE